MLTENALKLFALSKLRGVGPKALRDLARHPAFSTTDIAECRMLNRRVAKALELPCALEEARIAAERDLAAAQAFGARVLCFTDRDYPSLLALTDDAPGFLYVLGSVEALQSTHAVAIIGTRRPTRHGSAIAHRIAGHYAEHGWGIVSGLALGCDTHAHEAALAAGGPTIAVLAHGLQTVAPKNNIRLAERIAVDRGALVSEFPFGTEPHPPQFVRRDRTQAGLARGVVMVQSGLNGGSLHASRACLEYGRMLAVPIPTETDELAASDSIQANVLLATGQEAEKEKLLRCNRHDLQKVMILRSREDYGAFTKRMLDETAASTELSTL